MADIDLTTNGWVDLVFEGRNQAYGAYKYSASRNQSVMSTSIVVISILAALLVGFYVAKTAYDQYLDGTPEERFR
jgi:protein TonB